jgi:hypothetical protein
VVKTDFGYLTAEARRARSKEFLIKTYSELSELGVSVVRRIRNNIHRGGAEDEEGRELILTQRTLCLCGEKGLRISHRGGAEDAEKRVFD